MRAALVLALLITACGGGGSPSSASSTSTSTGPALFGWWGLGNGFNNHLADGAQGNLAPVQGRDVAETVALVDQALALGYKPVVMLWSMLWRGQTTLRPDWLEQLQALRAAVDSKVLGYYVDDEPGLAKHSYDDVAAVAAALPADKLIMLSLSRPEVDLGVPVPPAVNLLGVNLYSGHGDTPNNAWPRLSNLTAYRRRMFLNLDAWAPLPSGSCSAVPEDSQRASVAMNEALLSWARSRTDVHAVLAFIWQRDDPGQVCGASELPILKQYMAGVAATILKDK